MSTAERSFKMLHSYAYLYCNNIVEVLSHSVVSYISLMKKSKPLLYKNAESSFKKTKHHFYFVSQLYSFVSWFSL